MGLKMIKPFYFDVSYPIICNKELDGSNSTKYLELCESFFEKHFTAFIEKLGYKKIISMELNIKDVGILLETCKSGFMYLSNVLIHFPEIVVTNQNFVEPHRNMTSFARQLSLTIVNLLDQIQSIYHQKYLKKHLTSLMDKIMEEIQTCDEILIESALEIQRVRFTKTLIIEKTDETIMKINRIIFYFSTLIDSMEIQHTKSEVINNLLKFGLNQVKTRISKAESNFNHQEWEKVVQDMRLALELVINFLVRKIQGNKYWDGRTGNGFEILHNKGIITDSIYLNHFKAHKVGVYGILSEKGSHAEGETTDNLANSDLEANYCMSLTLNVIQYLLMSFENSEYYENEH